MTLTINIQKGGSVFVRSDRIEEIIEAKAAGQPVRVITIDPKGVRTEEAAPK